MKFFQVVAGLLCLLMLLGCQDLRNTSEVNEIGIAPTVSDEIFIDNADIINDYNENEFAVNSKKAMDELIDSLVKSEKWQENFQLICSGMINLQEETYYQITLSTENDISYSDIGTFWVNADNGMLYIKFDPTLDRMGYFSEFAINIPKDDLRTRLILFS